MFVMKRRWIGLGVAGSMLIPAMGEVEEVYLDADDGGRHAVIVAFLEGEAGRERLVVRIRPHGQGVEGEGGWRSRAGFNAHTAREMESVLRARGFEARIRGPGGLVVPAEVAWKKEFATFPRRRMREDWSIDYFARTELLVSELSMQTTGRLRGRGVLELLARGEPRLLLDLEVAGKRILEMRMPGHSATVPVALLIAEQKVVAAMKLPANWAELKAEPKWQTYQRLVGEDVEKRGSFVEALKQEKDWLFLEQVALYSPGAYDTHSIGPILSRAKTPNWRRVAGWFARSTGGHGALHTQSLLGAEGEKAKTLGWLNKYEKRLDPGLLAMKNQWVKAGVQPENSESDLPPHLEDEVFVGIGAAYMKREGPMSEANIAWIARGIQGWAISQRWGSPWGEKVVDLIEDPDWRIAESASLAFTHGKNNAVPMGILWEVAHDGKKDQRLREAAFLGWSYGSWGEVFIVLHDVAGKPDDALWMPAVSRLGELGNGWTIEMLQEYSILKGVKGRRNRLNSDQRRLVQQEIKILRERLAKGKLTHDFETTAWASVLGFSRSADMEDWMLKRYGIAEFANADSRKVLASVRGWRGPNQPPKVKKERLEVRKRLLDELEFRWEQSKKKAN
jgi:hypothetical protein